VLLCIARLFPYVCGVGGREGERKGFVDCSIAKLFFSLQILETLLHGFSLVIGCNREAYLLVNKLYIPSFKLSHVVLTNKQVVFAVAYTTSKTIDLPESVD